MLAKNMAGEITLSETPGQTLKKWREIFGVRQTELSKALGTTPSVIADYEGGRRKNPGTGYVKKAVDALIRIDVAKGGEVVGEFSLPDKSSAILDIREFASPVPAKKILAAAKAEVYANKKGPNANLMGYTIIDSIQAILTLTGTEFPKIYGSTTERALVFLKVASGRSPMIALRVTTPKPRLVILHGLKPYQLDPLAKKIAEVENIPVAVSKLKEEETLINNVKQFGGTDG